MAFFRPTWVCKAEDTSGPTPAVPTHESLQLQKGWSLCKALLPLVRAKKAQSSDKRPNHTDQGGGHQTGGGQQSRVLEGPIPHHSALPPRVPAHARNPPLLQLLLLPWASLTLQPHARGSQPGRHRPRPPPVDLASLPRHTRASTDQLPGPGASPAWRAPALP